MASPQEVRRSNDGDRMKVWSRTFVVALLAALYACAAPSHRRGSDLAFVGDYPTAETQAKLKDELYFQKAVQSYLWALPALNMTAMKEASEAKFGKGYNVLP